MTQQKGVARRFWRMMAAGVLAVLCVPALVLAEAPAGKWTQVPGYYRMALGDFEVTALFDGVIKLDPKLLKGMKPQDIARYFERMFLGAASGVPTAVNAYLVNTGTNLVLVDTGMGKGAVPSLGFMADNLRAAGYDPAQVDTVLLTHLHPDHVLGLVTSDGQMAFPNATVRVAALETAKWLSDEEAAKAPEQMQRLYKGAKRGLAPYLAAGKVKTFGAGDALVPGVESVPLLGHTPGHFGFMFSSRGQNLLTLGDVVHSYSVQFARPEVSIDFDTDQKAAVATRKRVFAQAAGEGCWVAGAHIPFPGIGHVRAEKKGYSWVPVEFGPVGEGK